MQNEITSLRAMLNNEKSFSIYHIEEKIKD